MQENQDELWWIHETRARIFNKCIQRHILSLSIAYLMEGIPRACWVSGFLVQTKGLLIWMTAGHVLKKLNEIIELKEGCIKARWIDNCPNKDAQCMPCDYPSLHPISVDVEGYDFGIVLLRQLYRDQLLKIKENMPLTQVHWSLDDDFKAQGYYLVGLPQEFTKLEQIATSSEAHEYRSSSTIVSVPLMREYPTTHQAESEFWKHKDNFYGKVFPIRNDDGDLLTDISGMSGGPIFGVVKIDKSRFEYRLIAVQSCWLPQSMFTRGTRFDKVIDILNPAIELALSSNRRQVP
jgi:hypothetical protein